MSLCIHVTANKDMVFAHGNFKQHRTTVTHMEKRIKISQIGIYNVRYSDPTIMKDSVNHSLL